MEQVSESGMFSRAEESVALNSHKFGKVHVPSQGFSDKASPDIRFG